MRLDRIDLAILLAILGHLQRDGRARLKLRGRG